MREIVTRLHENRQVELAKSILESNGYEVNMNEEEENTQKSNPRNEMTENPTFKKMEALCQKYGYVLREAYIAVYKNGFKYTPVSIKAVEEFHPEIYYQSDFYGKKVSYFEIQTISYGALKLEEYAEFLEGCHAARDLVSELSEIDLDTLAVWEKD